MNESQKKGVLADAVLSATTEAPTTPTVTPQATVKPTSFPKPDTSYIEPLPVPVLRAAIADAIERKDAEQLIALAYKACDRADSLFDALLPIATHGMMMANVQMSLIAEGRKNEPCGGTWLNGLKSAQMQSNDSIFFRAMDAIGKKRTEEHVMEIFNRVQAAAIVATEREVHATNKTLVGPTGGPVDGQIH